MAVEVKVDVKTWQNQTPKGLYAYIKPTIDNNRYYRCIKEGTTGLTEPFWTVSINSQIIDGTVIWQCTKVIEADFDINSFLPEINQTQDLYLQSKDLLTLVLSENKDIEKNIENKFKDFYQLDDVFLKNIIKEKGYDYISEAKIISQSTLANIYAYLKIIHLLKGTRKGLRLVLDLLGYPYLEKLWYETTFENSVKTWQNNKQILLGSYIKPTVSNNRFYKCTIEGVTGLTEPSWSDVIGSIIIDGSVTWECLEIEVFPEEQPHTANLILQIPFESFTPKTLANLIFFLRSYVYPLINVLAEIDPFIFLSSVSYGSGVGDYYFDYDMNFEVTPIIPSVLAHYSYTENIGIFIADDSEYSNNAIIKPSENSLTTLLRYIYTANTGTSIADITDNANNSSIVTSLTNYLRLRNTYTENIGTSIADNSTNGNTTSIITSFVNSILAHYSYTENTGTSIADDGNLNNDSNIVSTGFLLPRTENIIAKYDLITDALDSSGNSLHGTLGGGASFSGGVLDFGDNDTDYLSIPNSVLNGKTTFSISFWAKIKGLHTTGTLPYNFFFSSANSTVPDTFNVGYKASTKKIAIVLNDILYELGNANTTNVFEDVGFHNFVITRDSAGTVRIYVDKHLLGSATLPSLALVVDSGGLIFNQDQDSVGAGFVTNQSGYLQLKKLLFYDIVLTQNEVNNINTIGF